VPLASPSLSVSLSLALARALAGNPSHAVTQTDAETNGAVDSGVAGATAEAQDNNGLSRGQNFAKVEKWLRDAARHSPIVIVPGVIANIEDPKPGAAIAPGAYDPPTEHDRLPPIARRCLSVTLAARCLRSCLGDIYCFV
jgi:hypothetical protein